MTKEMAAVLLERKDIYLTEEGRQRLAAMLMSEKKVKEEKAHV